MSFCKKSKVAQFFLQNYTFVSPSLMIFLTSRDEMSPRFLAEVVEYECCLTSLTWVFLLRVSPRTLPPGCHADMAVLPSPIGNSNQAKMPHFLKQWNMWLMTSQEVGISKLKLQPIFSNHGVFLLRLVYALLCPGKNTSIYFANLQITRANNS